MITSELNGGLGHQMFQISSAVSLSLSNNDTFGFNLNNSKYNNNIFSKIYNIETESKSEYIEPFFNYYKIEYKPNLKLIGNYQSERYFYEFKNEITDLFSPLQETESKMLNFIEKCNINNKTTVSLHVKLEEDEFRSFVGLDYIKKALSIFDDCLIFVISDDLNWCKNNVKSHFNDLIFVNENFEDYELMCLMSNTTHNIISNSAFSWWGSYLNTNPNKNVITHRKWFNENFKQPYYDIFYKNIIII